MGALLSETCWTWHLSTLQPGNLRLRTGYLGAVSDSMSGLIRRLYKCPSEADVGRAELDPLDITSWETVRRAGLNPLQPVPDSWDWNPPGF